MKLSSIPFVLAALLTTSQALAQAPVGVATEDLLALKRNSLSVATHPAGFFEGLAIERDGQRIDIGFFGGDAGAYFTEKGLAQQSLRAYRTQKIVGVSLWSAGMAALVADLGLTLHSLKDRSSNRGLTGMEMALFGSGAVTGIVGAILIQSATGHLVDAVAQHNSALLDEAIDQSMRPALGLGTDGRGASVNLALSF